MRQFSWVHLLLNADRKTTIGVVQHCLYKNPLGKISVLAKKYFEKTKICVFYSGSMPLMVEVRMEIRALFPFPRSFMSNIVDG